MKKGSHWGGTRAKPGHENLDKMPVGPEKKKKDRGRMSSGIALHI